MTKEELRTILEECEVPVDEGITFNFDSKTKPPRIDFWEIAWEDVVGSGDTYQEKDTIQISFYSRIPRDKALIKLRSLLRDAGMHPIIQHEFIKEDMMWHSYMAVEVMHDE